MAMSELKAMKKKSFKMHGRVKKLLKRSDKENSDPCVMVVTLGDIKPFTEPLKPPSEDGSTVATSLANQLNQSYLSILEDVSDDEYSESDEFEVAEVDEDFVYEENNAQEVEHAHGCTCSSSENDTDTEVVRSESSDNEVGSDESPDTEEARSCAACIRFNESVKVVQVPRAEDYEKSVRDSLWDVSS